MTSRSKTWTASRCALHTSYRVQISAADPVSGDGVSKHLLKLPAATRTQTNTEWWLCSRDLRFESLPADRLSRVLKVFLIFPSKHMDNDFQLMKTTS